MILVASLRATAGVSLRGCLPVRLLVVSLRFCDFSSLLFLVMTVACDLTTKYTMKTREPLRNLTIRKKTSTEGGRKGRGPGSGQKCCVIISQAVRQVIGKKEPIVILPKIACVEAVAQYN